MLLRSAFLVVLLSVSFALFAEHAADDRGQSDLNLSYASVLAQPYREANHTLPYAKGDLQFGKLWIPTTEAPKEGFPLVIFIHGGCWLSAYDIDHSRAFTSGLADHGYAVWSLEYRRIGNEGGGWPGTFEDILQGIGYVKHLASYKVNTHNVILSGHSAGGHLALLAATTRLPINLKQVLGFAAITDIQRYGRGENSCQKAVPQFMGRAENNNDVANIDDANPATKVLHYPVTLFHGSADTIVPEAQSALVGTTLNNLHGAGHFDWIHPESAGFQLILSTLKRHD